MAQPTGCTHGDGAGGTTTGGRSLQVMVLGTNGPSQFVPGCHGLLSMPSLPPTLVRWNSEPAGVKWNVPQLFTPVQPTLRTSTFSNVALPATRALKTEVPRRRPGCP